MTSYMSLNSGAGPAKWSCLVDLLAQRWLKDSKVETLKSHASCTAGSLLKLGLGQKRVLKVL